jgi:hypothetical protein
MLLNREQNKLSSVLVGFFRHCVIFEGDVGHALDMARCCFASSRLLGGRLHVQCSFNYGNEGACGIDRAGRQVGKV